MDEEQKNNPLKTLFTSANSVLIILPPEPDEDLVSASLSLHLSLKFSGKSSQIGCDTNVQSLPDYLGLNEIKESVGSKNLHITFDYPEENLEKVDYEATPNGKFSLLVKPKAGAPIPDISSVKFSYSGADSDLVIVFGINSLEELGRLYADEKKFLDSATLLSINTISQEATFTPNMFHSPNISFSELVCQLFQRINLTASPEAAQNLLNSIFKSTSNLTSPKVTAETFSTVAILMRAGASLPQSGEPHNFINSPARPSFFEAPPQGNIFQVPQPQDPIPSDWKSPKIFRANDTNPKSTDNL